MPKVPSPRPRSDGATDRHFMIVASQYNAGYVKGLVDHLLAELRALVPGVTTTLLQVPGAFEIPVVVREIASQKNGGDGIIAVGVILKGETDHAENLSRSVTDSLQRIAVAQAIPVINVVLSFDNEDQARVRCLEHKINRGTEAARTAVEMSNVMSKLRAN
ncbi:MAG TPA: 6,7-dimethyl-8-ribityllumazine synthase [Chthoniobacterales bacterium]|nr:6,7-dimethyl-8-ribityllumazine synthase [Chthoniobacterales bacterium]